MLLVNPPFLICAFIEAVSFPVTNVLATSRLGEIISHWSDTGTLSYFFKAQQKKTIMIASGIIGSEVCMYHFGIFLFDFV